MLPSDWLIKNGWLPRGASPGGDGGCLVNAMGSTGYRITDMGVGHQLFNELQVLTGDLTVVNWNDDKCPDAQTAVAVMRQAEINCGLRPVEEVQEPAAESAAASGRWSLAMTKVLVRGRPQPSGSPKMITDPELGLMRYCRLCEEYWPADLSFFFKNGTKGLHTYCKACCGDWKRIHEPGRNGSEE